MDNHNKNHRKNKKHQNNKNTRTTKNTRTKNTTTITTSKITQRIIRTNTIRIQNYFHTINL